MKPANKPNRKAQDILKEDMKQDKLQSDPIPMNESKKSNKDPLSHLFELDKIINEQGTEAAIKWADNWLNS